MKHYETTAGFPMRIDHPATTTIPKWPDWTLFEQDLPRVYWMTRMGTKIYAIVQLAGEIEMYENYPVIKPQEVYLISLMEMREHDWGYAPPIVHFKEGCMDDLEIRRKEIMDELDQILAIHYL